MEFFIPVTPPVPETAPIGTVQASRTGRLRSPGRCVHPPLRSLLQEFRKLPLSYGVDGRGGSKARRTGPEIYIIDSSSSDDPESFITELQIPIKEEDLHFSLTVE